MPISADVTSAITEMCRIVKNSSNKPVFYPGPRQEFVQKIVPSNLGELYKSVAPNPTIGTKLSTSA